MTSERLKQLRAGILEAKDALTDADVNAIVKNFTQRGVVPSDALAMALVKQFLKSVTRQKNGDWLAVLLFPDEFTGVLLPKQFAKNYDLNTAIIMLVAKMQAEK